MGCLEITNFPLICNKKGSEFWTSASLWEKGPISAATLRRMLRSIKSCKEPEVLLNWAFYECLLFFPPVSNSTETAFLNLLLQSLIFSKEPFNQEAYDEHVKGLQAALKKFEDLYIGITHTYLVMTLPLLIYQVNVI